MRAPGPAQRSTLGTRLRLTAAGLAATLTALVCATFLFVHQAHLVKQAIAEDARLDNWERQLQSVLSDLADAETGQRGYLLTGRERYLAPYRAAATDLPAVLLQLDALSAEAPALRRLIRDIHVQTDLKLAELVQTLRLYDLGQQHAALALVQTDVGQRYMEQLRSDIDTVLKAVRADRRSSSDRVLAGSVTSERLAVAAVSALVILVLLAALQISNLLAARTRYERALAASEQRHRALIDEQTECIALAHADGKLSYVNRAYAEFFAVPRATPETGNLYDTVVADDLPRMRECIAAMLTDGQPTAIETRVMTAQGDEKWLSWRHHVQQGAPGQQMVHAVGRDVTLRKNAEAALRASEQRLEANERFIRTITDNVPVRLGYFDGAQRLRFVNQALCERLGAGREQLLGKTIAESAAAAALRQVQARLPAAAAGRVQRFEYTEEIQGVRRRLETFLIPDTGAASQVRGVFWVAMDITRLKSTEHELRQLTEVFDNTSDFVAQTDWRGEVQYLNPAARGAVGFGAGQPLVGHSFAEFFTAETNARWASEILPAVQRDGVWIGETAVVLKGSHAVPVSHIVIAHRDTQGRIARYSSVIRDISAEVTARRELARQTATLNAIVEAIPAMVAVWDTELRYRLVNQGFERWRATRREAVIGRTLEEVIGSEEYQLSLPWVKRALAGETVTYEKEYPTARELRHVAVTYIPLYLQDGAVGAFIGVAQDITQQREENVRLLLLSERDALTGLLNRAGFEHYLTRKIEQGDGASLAILYVDLDHFKPINDTYGHATGDDVLREFARRLQSVVRPSDAVARLGGDEFGVVLAGVRDPEDAARVADKVVQMARQPIAHADHNLTIGASVGVAFSAEADGGWKGLLARADAMLYSAKAGGRGRTVLAVDQAATDVPAASENRSQRTRAT